MLPADASGTELLGEPGASILIAQHAEIAASRPKSFFAHIKDCLPLKTSTASRSLPPMNEDGPTNNEDKQGIDGRPGYRRCGQCYL